MFENTDTKTKLDWMCVLTNEENIDYNENVKRVTRFCLDELKLNMIEDRRARFECSVLKWKCLSQIVSLWHDLEAEKKKICNYALQVFCDEEQNLEFEVVTLVLDCCCSNDDAALKNYGAVLEESLKRRFDEIVVDYDNKESFIVLQKWSALAMRQRDFGPFCLSVLKEVEMRHGKFAGIVSSVVESHCIPVWKEILRDSDDSVGLDMDVEAKMLSLLSHQSYFKDETRKLESKSSDSNERKNAIFLPRAYVATFLLSLKKRHIVCDKVAETLASEAVLVKRMVDKERECQVLKFSYFDLLLLLISVHWISCSPSVCPIVADHVCLCCSYENGK